MNPLTKMTIDQIITASLVERGLDPKSKKLRAEYDPEVVRKARDGDLSALNQILRIGGHRN